MQNKFHDDPRAFRDFLDELGVGDCDPGLARLALTHRSFAFEAQLDEDNERLEFLGDAVLGFVCSRYLYDRKPEADEGDLSKLRAKIVSRSLLGRIALDMGLGPFVLLGKGEEASGGRKKKTLLGCVLEAVIGAVYMSAGIEAAEDFIIERVIRPAHSLLKEEDFIDYKSRLQEYAQKEYQTVPQYRTAGESGPDHAKRFRVETLINGRVMGRGEGASKKSAENAAARAAMKKLGLF